MIIGISGKIGAGKDTVASIIQYLTSDYKDDYTFTNWTDRVNNFGSSPHSSWEVKRFAGKLKQIVSLLTGCTVENLEDQEFKKQSLGEQWNWSETLSKDMNNRPVFCRSIAQKQPFLSEIKSYTYREMLQLVGTEAMRNQIHENVWVNALFSDYKPSKRPLTKEELEFYKREDVTTPLKYPQWIISDLRFPNELKAIEDREGITIRINRKWRTYEIPSGKVTETRYIPGFDPPEHPSETALDNAKFTYTIDNDGTIEDLIEKVREILIQEKII